MKGRRPMSKAVKELTGSAAKDPQRVNHNEVKAKSGRPPMPEAVKEDPIAAGCWNRICDQLDEMQMLTTADEYLLMTTCICYSQMQALHKEIRGGNVCIENSNGMLVSHPCALHYHKFQDRFLKCLDSLGLTPGSRIRLHAPNPDEELDEFQNWLAAVPGGKIDN